MRSNILPVSSALLVIGTLLLSACGPDSLSNKPGLMPAAFGKANRLTVIADSSWWASGLSDSVDFTFGAPFLILPRPEPLYELRHFDWKDVEYKPARKELRSYLIASYAGLRGTPVDDLMRKDLGDSLLPSDRPYSVKFVRNRWAKGQVLFYVYGRDEEAVYDAIRERGPAMLEKLKVHDLPILESQTFAARDNVPLSGEVFDVTGAHFRIPGEFVQALKTDRIVWLRKDAPDMILSLVFQRVPYTDASQFGKEGLIAMQDRMTSLVTGDQDSSRMVVDDRNLPVFLSTLTLDGQYAVEARGIWSMLHEFMGGPFISYAIQTPDKSSVILATGFLYGPGKDKREWMQQLEVILKTLDFP